MLNCGFSEFFHWGLSLSFKAQCPPQIERHLCLAGYHVVAQTRGLSSGIIWNRLVKFQRAGVVLRTLLCARLVICCVFVPGLIPVFQSSVSPLIERNLCIAGCHVVPRT